MRTAGWRLLISATGVHRTEGFRYAIDNGAWTAHQQSQAFDEAAFEKIVRALGADADWIAIPDIVMGGLDSLAFSLSWIERLRKITGTRLLLPVQDGMEPKHVEHLIGAEIGIFVGGGDRFKEGTMPLWCALGRSKGATCHIGRVNTTRRIFLCEAAGATSFDGSSVTRFVKNLPKLDGARRQTSFDSRWWHDRAIGDMTGA